MNLVSYIKNEYMVNCNWLGGELKDLSNGN